MAGRIALKTIVMQRYTNMDSEPEAKTKNCSTEELFMHYTKQCPKEQIVYENIKMETNKTNKN